jgi:hypothetical protein
MPLLLLPTALWLVAKLRGECHRSNSDGGFLQRYALGVNVPAGRRSSSSATSSISSTQDSRREVREEKV